MEQQSFLQYDVPYPILTITNADVAAGMCVPGNGSVWEVSPFEFGSWDPRVGAFYPTQYIGTSTAQGPGNCTAGFDNIGFLTATSSNVLIVSANNRYPS
jgi:lysophospholipase